MQRQPYIADKGRRLLLRVHYLTFEFEQQPLHMFKQNLLVSVFLQFSYFDAGNTYRSSKL